jgi:hypothetical protein
MPETKRRSLHPLLLERSYWRNRLQVLKLARPSVLLIPRPELSDASVDVDEFRIRAHDGVRLFGLRAQSRLGAQRSPARIRIVGPCEIPEIDRTRVDVGECEFVFQEPAGRRLEDRVLDVLRICQVAAQSECVRADQVQLVSASQQPDEFLIASHLLAEEVTAPPLSPRGESGLPDLRLL